MVPEVAMNLKIYTKLQHTNVTYQQYGINAEMISQVSGLGSTQPDIHQIFIRCTHYSCYYTLMSNVVIGHTDVLIIILSYNKYDAVL